jgi:membrane-associated phospholipid phosphatase
MSQDTAMVFTTRKNIGRALIAPLLLFTAGAVSNSYKYDVRTWRNDYHADFHTTADNYLQYAPILAVYGLDLSGVKAQNDLVNQTVLLIKSELLMSCIVQPMKYSTQVLRPDGSNRHSFPSGHTAEAFMAATFLHKEFGRRSIWYSIGGYAAATTVGAMRVLNNKHWISDVMVGAGIGILSTEIVYLTHQFRWGKSKKTDRISFSPTYSNGPGIYFSYRPD